MKKPFFLFILLVAGLLSFITNAKAEAPTENNYDLQNRSIDEVIDYYAGYYGTDASLMKKVMQCESQGDPDMVGDHNLSHGLFQIQKSTWNRFTKQMGETLDYTRSFDQIKVTAWAFAHGDGPEWSTFRAIENGGSYTFFYKLENKEITIYCK